MVCHYNTNVKRVYLCKGGHTKNKLVWQRLSHENEELESLKGITSFINKKVELKANKIIQNNTMPENLGYV